MASDERERPRFLTLGDMNGTDDDTQVSLDAYQLHAFATVNSVQEGRPGLVTDEYLDGISAKSTLAAVELCTLGLWHRVEGGYVVLDRQTLLMALQADELVSGTED